MTLSHGKFQFSVVPVAVIAVEYLSVVTGSGMLEPPPVVFDTNAVTMQFGGLVPKSGVTMLLLKLCEPIIGSRRFGFAMFGSLSTDDQERVHIHLGCRDDVTEAP